jgi:hypothetical protein
MSRRVFGFAAALSVLLCIVTALAWLSSYNDHERYVWHAGPDSWALVTCDGCLQLKQMQKMRGYGFERGYHLTGYRAYSAWEVDGAVLKSCSLPGGVGWHYGGVLFQGSSQVPVPTYSWYYQTFYCFYWLPFLLTALLPALWLIRFCRRKLALRSGHCHVCQYDLRASTERCPECGAAVSDRPSWRWCPPVVVRAAQGISIYLRRF